MDRQLRQVSEVGQAMGFERGGKGVAQVRCRDGVIEQCLTAHRFVAENAKADAVTFRLKAPVFERQSCKDPTAAAHTGDADSFSLQISRRFYFWRHHNITDELI